MEKWVQLRGVQRFMRRMIACGAIIATLTPNVAFAIANPFFSTHITSFSDLSAFTKWTSLMPRYMDEHAKVAARCPDETCANIRWEALLASLQKKPLAVQMKEVNRFFNAVRYIEDMDNFGQADYWQTPYEFMKSGGDCEDYAIAKYISLKRLGVPESSMRIMIVQDNNLGGIMHAVLEVRSGSARFLLDNQVQAVTNQKAVFHYRPIYAINAQSWWAYQ